MTMEKQPACSSALASSARARAASCLRPCTLKPPMALTDWGVRPMWPITGISASISASIIGSRLRAALELHGLGAGPDEPGGVDHRVLDRHVVAEPREVGHDQRRRLGPGDGRRVVDHVVDGHLEGVLVARARPWPGCRPPGSCRCPRRRPCGPPARRRRSPSPAGRPLGGPCGRGPKARWCVRSSEPPVPVQCPMAAGGEPNASGARTATAMARDVTRATARGPWWWECPAPSSAWCSAAAPGSRSAGSWWASPSTAAWWWAPWSDR